MPDRDFYPGSMDARALWLANFVTQLPNFSSKYNIPNPLVASLTADSTWMTFWVDQRHQLDAFSQQVAGYFNTIAGKALGTAPLPLNFVVGASSPPEVPVGVEKRVRDVAQMIKGHIMYTDADGQALGIVVPGGGGPSFPGGIVKPAITLTTRVAFEIGVKFRKLGMTGIRLEYRHSGGNWLPAGSLFTSPGTFQVTPTTPNTPEQIEVRAVYLQGNTPTGDYSDTGSVYVGP